jgi:FlaA1/EpsC-like NDP-sugar epimerase
MSLSPALAPKFPERVTLGPNEVVVITGGSGFLGQHIIRVLNERSDGIREIRVVDLKPYKQKLGKILYTQLLQTLKVKKLIYFFIFRF